MKNTTSTNKHPQISESELNKQRIIEAMQKLPPHEFEKAFYLISRPQLVAKVYEATKNLPHDEMGFAVRRMTEADMEATHG